MDSERTVSLQLNRYHVLKALSTLSQKSETVAQVTARAARQRRNSATVALLCDSRPTCGQAINRPVKS